MNLSFFELFGQVGATVVSLTATLFIAYLIYFKEQRDKIGNQIITIKRKINIIVREIIDIPIPGVSHQLVLTSSEDMKWEKLSITSITAGPDWDLFIERNVERSDIWDQVRTSLEDLVRGIIPDGYFPEISIDSIDFRNWANNFMSNTNHIEWFCHELGQNRSWFTRFMEKFESYERKRRNPVLNSQDVRLMIYKILELRDLINEDLILEQNYNTLKIENSFHHYNLIIIGFFIMAVSSIVVPLFMLLLNPNQYVTEISWISLMLFLLFSIFTMWLLITSTKK